MLAGQWLRRRARVGGSAASRIAAFSSLLFTVLLAANAGAFCRTTTCTGDSCPKDAEGCPTTGYKLYWPTNCVGFNVQRDGNQFLDKVKTNITITKSILRWSGLACSRGTASLTFAPGETAYTREAEFKPAGKNINVIFFRDGAWIYKGIDGTIATTSVSFDKDTGEIWDADIAINGAGQLFSILDEPVDDKTQNDLESVMTHEAGHFVGVAHSEVAGSVMGPKYTGGTLQRALGSDDIEAVCAIYPPGRKASCNPDPKGGFEDVDSPYRQPGCGCASTTQPADAVAYAGVVLTLSFAMRRRRLRAKRSAQVPERVSS
jgi:MYXO-CTERM domain-containing protein